MNANESLKKTPEQQLYTLTVEQAAIRAATTLGVDDKQVWGALPGDLLDRSEENFLVKTLPDGVQISSAGEKPLNVVLRKTADGSLESEIV